ncbi:hypothetical protein ACIBQ0_10035 [Nocardia nova]|uniref:hypothetical protein n=1 Tax=Nocardia nova TaxID=37330 RepID=UPI0037993923
MFTSLSTVALLACPVGMGLMMLLMMMRGSDKHASGSDAASETQAEIAALRSEIAALKGGNSPAPTGRPE